MRKIIIAIDGFSGTGKSSTARAVADKLGYTYIDSGAMYRAATLHFISRGVDILNSQEVKAALNEINMAFTDGRIWLNNGDVTDEIRTMKVNEQVSQVSTNAAVRKAMVNQQQKMGLAKGIVMDGRDIGSVVFPEAELKIFMTAKIDVRAKRRQLELSEKGIHEELNVVQENLQERDSLDSTRAESPLMKTSGSIEIDTSNLSFNDQVQRIVELAEELIYED